MVKIIRIRFVSGNHDSRTRKSSIKIGVPIGNIFPSNSRKPQSPPQTRTVPTTGDDEPPQCATTGDALRNVEGRFERWQVDAKRRRIDARCGVSTKTRPTATNIHAVLLTSVTNIP